MLFLECLQQAVRKRLVKVIRNDQFPFHRAYSASRRLSRSHQLGKCQAMLGDSDDLASVGLLNQFQKVGFCPA
ncbi:hypothetical protein TU73_05110 [Pseudomonas libanensis]|uniref:Uncharacterized protein n=1 Tax=Pseudomonas libanensis TaxID=75588 RepID=A0A0R2YQA5_9PSED|nr:hypothetical protein TU73_05110 [Pseudomonas libanensis]